MGHETIAGFQETERSNLGCATNEGKIKNSSKSEDGCCSKTVISAPKEFPSSNCCSTSLIDSENRSNDSISGKSARVSEMKEKEKSWVIDVKCGEIEMKEGERVCRICHLSSEQSLKDTSIGAKKELICLGCGCKGELSVAHLHCAEAWFKLKGNRKCEICGEMVRNIRGVGAEKFMEEWIESGLGNNAISNEPNSHRRREEVCWHGQPLCNFLMACLVIAFVLPWFFRINGNIW